ncbi:hypothetical protein P692DRAFT_201229416 [Suillus brevipes Sb2]|nr:hypothetical protein P692DRAFT_201229416 [Suillus brevipes Sb2]
MSVTQYSPVFRPFVFSAGLAQRRLFLVESYTLALMVSHTFSCIRQSMNNPSQKFHYVSNIYKHELIK